MSGAEGTAVDPAWPEAGGCPGPRGVAEAADPGGGGTEVAAGVRGASEVLPAAGWEVVAVSGGVAEVRGLRCTAGASPALDALDEDGVTGAAGVDGAGADEVDRVDVVGPLVVA